MLTGNRGNKRKKSFPYTHTHTHSVEPNKKAMGPPGARCNEELAVKTAFLYLFNHFKTSTLLMRKAFH